MDKFFDISAKNIEAKWAADNTLTPDAKAEDCAYLEQRRKGINGSHNVMFHNMMLDLSYYHRSVDVTLLPGGEKNFLHAVVKRLRD